ncbi:Carbamoyl-phosphate synthase large chain [Neobacillus rhizosphaerae]|uniref:Carbamoyl-phosphate synthase large chain n=1 Tax=Neobacillus rhizosphaerae TaxID=2880965 RepID=A0ABM9EQH3_9BACI|nr:ATP-grasp domain-containing protein [Neobacillus rhizosphaerae]CAH2714890.1 Carbamoyl-phosphate synthase large chain [Neobacillus rhizosphaerae]
MKKILFLGGTVQQIPAIIYAKDRGYYTILCDYQSNTPGQNYSDEYYCISTTDKVSILEIARKKNIDGIVAYISDTAAPTAAYVANKLNLPSYPCEAVAILTKKDLFRKFLRENGFNSPKAKSYKTITEAKKDLTKFQLPLMVKPIDSSGSRGISRIDSIEEIEIAFESAISKSREKTVIVEEFIEMTHDHQIGGDVFIMNGKLEFCGFLNCHRNNQVNPNVPVGKSYPLFLDEKRTEMVRNDLQRLIDLLKIKIGALNIEAIIGQNGKVYFIDVGPRNGGNLIPDFLKIITGIDCVMATVEAALGNEDLHLKYEPNEGYYSTYTLHSAEQGKLTDIIFNNEIEKNIINKFIFKEKGEEIGVFNDGTKAIGFVFLKFSSLKELKYKMNHISQYIEVQVN